MNAIDRMIGYFSPERGYRRAQYRAATQVFAYDGAKSGRRTDSWIAAGGDANTEYIEFLHFETFFSASLFSGGAPRHRPPLST
jgi:hypothetical protein